MTLPYSIGSRVPLTTAERAYLGAKAALALLDDTEGGVADQLRARNVRGADGFHARSPLAMYLRGRTEFVWIVEANTATCYLGRDVVTVPLPAACARFVREWQGGAYRDLCGEPSTGTVGPVSLEQMHEAWRAGA